MRYTINAAKSIALGDGVYVRRWHGNSGLGIELGTRNGEREFDQVFLSPNVLQELIKYLHTEKHIMLSGLNELKLVADG